MKAFEENPNNPEANFGLGILSQKDEKYDIAINYFRKALELKPNTLDYLFRLAYTLSSLSKSDEALEFYKKYEALEPKHVNVLHNIAIIYCAKGMHDIEHNYYKKALELDARYDYPYVSGAVCFRNRKMLKEALDLTNKGLEMRPNDLRITEQRGYVYFDMSEFDKAKKDLEYVILYQPSNNYVKATLDKLSSKTTKTNPELTDFAPQNPSLNFESVAGMDEFKKWVNTNIISSLKNAKLAEKYKKRFGGGLVFYGPPGCGKTYLANALAGEAKLKLIKVKISEILNMWMGNSERNIRNLFETARKNAPCIIFLDEIEGLGGKRSDSAGGSKWLNILVNQLLMEMSEIDHNSEKVLVIGA
ncbi:AAA family ATPase, partial [Candidatus Micrarchaeota archaeon]|nr:AAA family ATPase [Candidatus Micrarchaeota archaeon]